MTLTKQETATVLAALRYWQQEISANNPAAIIDSVGFFAECEPLDEFEIDALCEKINCQGGDAAVALLLDAIDRWPEIGSEKPISGADCVDWLADFLRDARRVVKREGE